MVAQRWAEMRTKTASQEDFHIYDIPMPIKNQTLAKLTPAELRTWICTGTVSASSGCTHMTQEDHWLYHASGPPMLAHREDWDGWLVDSWRDITLRLRLVYKRYFLDMWSWMLANIHHRQRLGHFWEFEEARQVWLEHRPEGQLGAPASHVNSSPALGWPSLRYSRLELVQQFA